MIFVDFSTDASHRLRSVGLFVGSWQLDFPGSKSRIGNQDPSPDANFSTKKFGSLSPIIMEVETGRI